MTFDFTDKVVAITGGAHGIGQCIASEFEAAGAHVCIFDLQPNPYFQGDLALEEDVVRFSQKVLTDYGHLDVLVNNAPPLFKGINTCSYEEFNRALRVGVTAPFFLTKLFQEHFRPNASIINISSSRDRMSQPQSESYTAAKGGIHALTHALAISLAGHVRVNSISPGWINTSHSSFSGPNASQQPVGRVGTPHDIAAMTLFLASPHAGFISGENICIDGGMTHLMIYHNDCGWSLNNTPN